ncbi:cytochrome P450 [Mycena metata]|uniref:Cytochrome P450 n=1 Tax=Mycena metata TaxID=1033252 RepID=A0AAD7GQM6_9AGAR|nr:cytochrome P450 [Mycena metata]
MAMTASRILCCRSQSLRHFEYESGTDIRCFTGTIKSLELLKIRQHDTPMSTPSFGAMHVPILLASAYALYTVVGHFRRRHSTPLQGPSSNNFVLGEWATRYGSVFAIPSIFGSKNIVLTDPKAIAHFYSKDTYGYIQAPHFKRFFGRFIGRGLFWAEGDSHPRQRRTLNPAFTNAAIRDLTPIFFDSAYKAKVAWDAILELEAGSSEGEIIEVQQRMNRISLDTIGLAGFSHDFCTLSGQTSKIADAFDSLDSKPSFLDAIAFLLSTISPIFDHIPTGRREMVNQLRWERLEINSLRNWRFERGEIRNGTFEYVNAVTHHAKPVFTTKIAGTDTMSQEEVKSQINVLLLPGYETTASKLSIRQPWALIELSRNPDIQTQLRAELFKAGDPTWDELTSHTSFLDAFTCEILRLHPPLPDTQRTATQDDIIPLSAPVETATGRFVDTVAIAKGTAVTVPINSMNQSVQFWGPDAKILNPSPQEIQGFRHLLTFSEGARVCLRKVFAVTEFKAVLSVLVRNFTFELPGGPQTVIGQHRNFLPRPKVVGESGYSVPLRVRQYVA